MRFVPSQLILKNGLKFAGLSPEWQTDVFSGEVVFNTGMTGYVESLTDPSYSGQILVFTYPLIGNYGVPAENGWESKKIHLSGIVVSEACLVGSHAEALKSLLNWLEEQRVPIIMNVDTRSLTKRLRELGVMPRQIQPLNFKAKKGQKNAYHQPQFAVARVTCSTIETYGTSAKKIIAVDCGMKENIIRELQEFPFAIKRVPFNYDYINENFDGVFLSNGPGDPAECTATIEILKKAMRAKKPIFGICLGSQIMALAAGAKTYKLPYGHRGHNQPCLNTDTNKCVITSQNHGYAVDEKTLPRGWRVNYRNLNDGSVEGVAHTSLPFFSVQFHPEAAPGPTDTRDLFEKFFSLL